MKFIKRTLPFLLLNILISAATVWLVLTYWEARQPAPPPTQAPLPAETQPSKPAETAVPAGESDVAITGVIGAGDLQVEYVLISNQGEDSVNLQGWSIESTKGEVYTFPNLQLNRNGAIRLYSRAGANTVIALNWGSAEPLWSSGDQLSLKDAAGVVQSVFSIP